MSRGKLFTGEEIDYILENYRELGAAVIAEKLGRTAHVIRSIYSRESRKMEDSLYSEQ